LEKGNQLNQKARKRKRRRIEIFKLNNSLKMKLLKMMKKVMVEEEVKSLKKKEMINFKNFMQERILIEFQNS